MARPVLGLLERLHTRKSVLGEATKSKKSEKLENFSGKTDFHDSKCIRFRKTLGNFVRGLGAVFLGNAFSQVHFQVAEK